MPWHRVLDQASEVHLGALQIGTTRRGIGPAYADKAARVGIRVQDLLDTKILREKIATALELKNEQLGFLYGIGRLDAESIQASAVRHAERLAPFIADVSLLVNDALDRGEGVLCEGAQGTLLDLDHGTYPFVTSSNPIAGAACVGLGHRADAHRRGRGRGQGVPHARGRGPVPERGGPDASSALREAGGEFGTVTGRPRRCGWLDLVGLRYASRVNGFTELVLTKLDVLSARRGDSRVRRLPAARRLGERALPRAPVRLPPRRAGVGDARGLGRADRRRAARSPTCRRRRSATWRSSPSASASRWASSASGRGAIRC